jgi:UDP-N-acetylmuramyl pentapeptide synthase
MLFGWYWNSIYAYVLASLIFSPIIIFFYILLTLPIVNFFKNRKIKKAILKSQIKNKPIKIAITWSYWKSSVKEFLSSILEQDWKTLKTPENINSELWVSSIVLNKLKSKYKYFVAEVWAYRIWEISLLWKIVNHKYWFLTAIWNQHIWLFGSGENIVKAKSEIAESVLKNNWVLYINIDNKEIKKEFDNKKSPIIPFNKGDEHIIKYWKSKKADAKYKILEEKNWKIEFSFEYKKINTKFKIDIIWEHNILNLTWVIACCYDLWLKTTDIKKYLKNLKTPKSSKTIIKSWKNILIDDTYNLSEAWLQSGLELFKNYKKHNKILVLDDILELWKDSEIIHFNIWKKIAENKIIDKILFCWVNYKESFIKWLLEWWFKKEDIISNLNNVKEKSVILFEWRNAKKYLNKIIK